MWFFLSKVAIAIVLSGVGIACLNNPMESHYQTCPYGHTFFENELGWYSDPDIFKSEHFYILDTRVFFYFIISEMQVQKAHYRPISTQRILAAYDVNHYLLCHTIGWRHEISLMGDKPRTHTQSQCQRRTVEKSVKWHILDVCQRLSMSVLIPNQLCSLCRRVTIG